jgi:hypothetical protein
VRTKLLAVAAAGALLPVLAFARHLDVADPNDSAGVLDLRRVTIYGSPPIWNLKTFRGWRARSIWDTGFLLVYFDTFASDRYDYYALVRSDGRRLRAALFRDRAKRRDQRVTRLKTWRPDRRRVKLRVPLRKMTIGKRRLFYRWYAQTLFTGTNCRRTCIDLAPDRTGVKEPLKPAPSPSPAIPDPS